MYRPSAEVLDLMNIAYTYVMQAWPPVRQFIYDVYIDNPVAHAEYGALLAEVVKEVSDSIKELRRRPRIKIPIYGPDTKSYWNAP